jgi:hypothetical protein
MTLSLLQKIKILHKPPSSGDWQRKAGLKSSAILFLALFFSPPYNSPCPLFKKRGSRSREAGRDSRASYRMSPFNKEEEFILPSNPDAKKPMLR